MNRSLIFLIGPRYAGKTSVGKIIAEVLGWTFYDLYKEIEEAEGVSIDEISARSEGQYLRDVEYLRLTSYLRGGMSVVATGEDTFIEGRNRELMREHGTVFYIEQSFETLAKRAETDARESRPLYGDRAKAYQRFREHQSIYREAHHTVGGNRRVVDIAKDIVERISQPVLA